MSDVEKAVEILDKQCPVCIMQCNTNYESNEKDFVYQNLNVLSTYKSKWPHLQTGLSCHLKSHISVLGAVSLRCISNRKTLCTDDCERNGPDHSFAMEPKEFKLMVEENQATREIARWLGKESRTK